MKSSNTVVDATYALCPTSAANPSIIRVDTVTDLALERTLSQHAFGALLQSLSAEGYTLVGPVVKDGAITYAEIGGISDLPKGMSEEQHAGSYRLRETHEPTLFRFASTAQSFKRFFHPPEVRLFSLRRSAQGPVLSAPNFAVPKLVLVGARACDIAALAVLDGVLAQQSHPHPDYTARRRDVIVIGLNCATAGGTCFCLAAGTGPRLSRDFDLGLSEVVVDGEARFVAQAGSATGERLLERVVSAEASPQDLELAEASIRACEVSLRLGAPDLSRVQEMLQLNAEHPQWQAIAERCLACGNCTAVCPTCFCTDRVEQQDGAGLAGQSEIWDSCFTADFSYLHGGSVRSSTRARYRQWLSHKFSTWFDQFGSSGCVGCGRCVTWCPVAIDVRAELAILSAPSTSSALSEHASPVAP